MTTPSLRALSLLGTCLFLAGRPALANNEAYEPLGNWEALPERNLGRTPSNWIRNTKFGEGEAILKAGNEGRELVLTVPESAKRPFHLYFRDLLPIPESGIMTITLAASGKGSIGAFCYLYNDSDVSLGIAPEYEEGMQSVNGESEVTLKFEANIGAVVSRKGSPASLRFALVVAPGSEITVKSIQTRAD